MMNDALSTIMTKEVITVTSNDDLQKVREVLLSKRLHHIPVVDNDRLVGIITTIDLWKMNKCYTEYSGIKVSDMMTKKMATLSPDDKIGVAAELFLENRFHAVPIVEGERLVGIVSSFDVMSYNFKKAYPRQFD